MSYFCAKAITINKSDKTFKVRGGDNNVVPRMDYWSNPIELKNLLSEIQSGNVQFTTKSDKHFAIMELTSKYEKMLADLTGFTAYELSAIISGNFDTSAHEESKAFYAKGFSNGYGEQQIALIDGKIALWNDSEKMARVNDIIAAFVTEVINLKIDKTKFVIRRKWDGVYVKRANRYSLSLTRSMEQAKQMSNFAAERILSGYDTEKYEIVKVGA